MAQAQIVYGEIIHAPRVPQGASLRSSSLGRSWSRFSKKKHQHARYRHPNIRVSPSAPPPSPSVPAMDYNHSERVPESSLTMDKDNDDSRMIYSDELVRVQNRLTSGLVSRLQQKTVSTAVSHSEHAPQLPQPHLPQPQLPQQEQSLSQACADDLPVARCTIGSKLCWSPSDINAVISLICFVLHETYRIPESETVLIALCTVEWLRKLNPQAWQRQDAFVVDEFMGQLQCAMDIAANEFHVFRRIQHANQQQLAYQEHQRSSMIKYQQQQQQQQQQQPSQDYACFLQRLAAAGPAPNSSITTAPILPVNHGYIGISPPVMRESTPLSQPLHHQQQQQLQHLQQSRQLQNNNHGNMRDLYPTWTSLMPTPGITRIPAIRMVTV